MEIDHSKAQAFRFCPWKYYEEYVRPFMGGEGVSLKPKPGDDYSALEYGERMHQLLEEWYKDMWQGLAHPFRYPPCPNEKLEAEAQLMMEAYKAHYPVEPFQILDVERTFRVSLPDLCPKCYSANCEPRGNMLTCLECGCWDWMPGRHVYIGKIDLAVEEEDALNIIDHKTEGRSAKSNSPQKWAVRDQASLYLWAAYRIYGRKPSNFYVNVLTRQSEKGQVGPSFPERQKLERSAAQIEAAIRDIIVVADDIERYGRVFRDNPWPANRENCYGYGQCAYWPLHGYGEDVDLVLQHKFEAKQAYLQLGGVPIIQ